MKKVLGVVLVLIAILVCVIVMRPNTFHIERSASIAASPDVVFAKLNDFHGWPSWSPWEKLDPNMTRSYGGSSAGIGATYNWSGNDKVGEGSMRITESHPGEKVVMRLEFRKPLPAVDTATFTLTPEGAGTHVTWAMDGPNNFMSKAFGLVMNMDQMVGKDFDTGLQNLKADLEGSAAQPATTDSSAGAAHSTK